ncbi:MAG: hypothetical protein KC776_25430 [Myxococcales bacterium]|nr:hypothetical protein [Myxococcales bacterium]
MMAGSESTSPLLMVATASGVLACAGVVWLAFRVSALEERKLEPTIVAAASVVPTPLPVVSAVAAPVPTVAPAPPAPLDPASVKKDWEQSVGARAAAICYTDAADAPTLTVALRIGAQGNVLAAVATPDSMKRAPKLATCVAGVLSSVQLSAPGKLVQGTVELAPPKKTR